MHSPLLLPWHLGDSGSGFPKTLLIKHGLCFHNVKLPQMWALLMSFPLISIHLDFLALLSLHQESVVTHSEIMLSGSVHKNPVAPWSFSQLMRETLELDLSCKLSKMTSSLLSRQLIFSSFQFVGSMNCPGMPLLTVKLHYFKMD